MRWEFDESVAKRFQKEAKDHIPDYDRVIDMCVDYALVKLNKHDYIIDVGSALGYTIDKFVDKGFTNVFGVESSEKMLEQSSHSKNIFLSSQFPNLRFRLVLINWTLHFIQDKKTYLRSVYDGLESNGTLILSDKTTQSDITKHLYYNFKRNNGVNQEYIEQKEQQLKGYMLTESLDYYFHTLKEIGFENIEIINSRFGFTTFICTKKIT
jgi:trans-aconitate methyltransferase